MKHLFRIILCTVCIVLQSSVLGLNTVNADVADTKLAQNELELYELIMQYRAQYGLPRIPLSPSLTYVAQTHARDYVTYRHEVPQACNMHSWSEHGNWSRCDYYDDHRNMGCMHSKPRELTSYQGNGYEISYMTSGTCTAEGALNGWKSSPGHNAVIINSSKWYDHYWKAIGIGIYKGYACVWFGEQKDPNTSPVNVRESQAYSAPSVAQEEKSTMLAPNDNKPKAPAPSDYKPVTPTPVTSSESRPIEEDKGRDLSGSQKTSPEKKSSNWLNRFYDYSGFSSLSYFSVGYTYSCMGGSHMISASMFDFRTSLFSASFLNVEMSVSPFNRRFAYKPNIRVYIPVAKCFSFVPYGGAEVDASYLGQYFDKNCTYDVDYDFYVSAIAGLAFNLTAARHVPMELKVEYRHPVLVPYSGAVNPQGIYVGAQIYLGRTFS